MADVTDDWIVADRQDEDALRPLDQSGLLSETPFSIGPEKILQPKHRLPSRGCEPLDTRYQDSEPPSSSQLLPHGMGMPVPKSKPRPRPVPTLAADNLIEEVNPMRTRKTQVKKPNYEPLTSDSNLDELSLKPPRKRQKSQDKPVEPKLRPRPKPKPKARTSPSPKVPEHSIVDTKPSNIVPALPSRLYFATSCLLSSIPVLPDLSSPPSSPPKITRKWKKVSPLQDGYIIVAANKGKTRDTKLSSWANGKKKGRKQADVELDDLAHKSPIDEPAAGNNGLEDDDFIEEEETKVRSKKKALLKPTSAAKSKSRKAVIVVSTAVLSESENEDNGDDPCSRSPNPNDNPKGSEIIVTPEITKIPPKTIAPPPKQTLSVTFQSRAFSIKPRSTPISELIRPPPPKKSNKNIEMEERIEEDLSETIEGWSCMIDEERRDLRRARIDAELCYE
ncbi:uncharacterized protein F5891DRAFT_1010991 [Suillus fuscotomentosus]|uniref:Uncharacterized protein n=1 Tax=Suillus fuscotomentosus TaxID=1912939 RepID=A0AAD4EHI6_9AGAM|nr:uncharacterized protein F5891DRAFT_1010991 [Suillus fuscotomentosus]KAG1905119.1 hypothetical protein F5891DRAFT_1010991 [Suillus fuscotomentosus]